MPQIRAVTNSHLVKRIHSSSTGCRLGRSLLNLSNEPLPLVVSGEGMARNDDGRMVVHHEEHMLVGEPSATNSAPPEKRLMQSGGLAYALVRKRNLSWAEDVPIYGWKHPTRLKACDYDEPHCAANSASEQANKMQFSASHRKHDADQGTNSQREEQSAKRSSRAD